VKKVILVLLTTFVLTNAYSQVINDDCSTAISLGYINFWTPPGYACFNAFSYVDTGFYSATSQNALVNYPYPIMTVPCSGYTTSISAPSNDVWYKALGVSCDLTIIFSCSDTTNLSIWTGTNCSDLCARNCYTLLPGGFIWDTIYSIGNIPVYFQISGPGINKYVQSFNMCLGGSQLNCSSDTTSCITQYLGLNSIDFDENIIVSPNPTKDIIEILSPQNSNIEIINVYGKTIHSINKSSIKTIVDLTNYSSGIYFIKTKTEKGMTIKKLIKQ
jgi:hypothetical protein